MVQRIKIDAAGGTFRVSVPGADVTTAQFGNLIFDGNQPPLRIAQNGFFSLNMIADSTWAAGQNTVESGPVGVTYIPPSGSFPIFMVMVRAPYTIPQGSGSVATSFPGEVRTACRMSGTATFGIRGNGSDSGAAGFRGAGGGICNGGASFLGLNFCPNEFQGSMFPPGNTFNFAYINYAIFKNYT